jgi:hypothetical protein
MPAWLKAMLDDLRTDTRRSRRDAASQTSARSACGRYRPPFWKLLLLPGIPLLASFLLMVWAILDNLLPPDGASDPATAATAFVYALDGYGAPTDTGDLDRYLCSRNADRLHQLVVAFRQTIHDHAGGGLLKLEITDQSTTVNGNTATTTMQIRPRMSIPGQNLWAVGDSLPWTFTEVHEDNWQVCDVAAQPGCAYINCNLPN